MIPHIPEPGEPLESKAVKRQRFIIRWIIIGIFIWTVVSCFYGITDYIDLLLNGPAPLRSGYIPKAYRINDNMKFVPKGEDPSRYVIPSYLDQYKASLEEDESH